MRQFPYSKYYVVEKHFESGGWIPVFASEVGSWEGIGQQEFRRLLMMNNQMDGKARIRAVDSIEYTLATRVLKGNR